MKGNRYKINVSGQEIFSDGLTIWTYEKASNEVTINKIDPSSNALTPQKLFTNFYDKDFLYKLNGMAKEGGKNMQEIELTPIDKTKTFHKVLLYIDKSMIASTKIFEKSGSRYTYTVSNLKSDAALTDQ
jgi:outer membrane lipoprotein-sorting protein